VAANVLFADDLPQGRFGRYKNAQARLQKLNQLLQLELRNEGAKAGANAVLRATFQKTVIGGFLLLSASGTAVRLGG
jgi:uncharacterized protein YbjQ (UPF0145 family)